jgi:hypothetical protein
VTQKLAVFLLAMLGCDLSGVWYHGFNDFVPQLTIVHTGVSSNWLDPSYLHYFRQEQRHDIR